MLKGSRLMKGSRLIAREQSDPPMQSLHYLRHDPANTYSSSLTPHVDTSCCWPRRQFLASLTGTRWQRQVW